MGKLLPPSSKDIENALSNTDWDFSNRILYDLCANHPLHERDDVIMAKVMLIGRAYAAAIERGRGIDGVDGDNFYKDTVARIIREHEIDTWFLAFNRSSEDKGSNQEDIVLNIEVHLKLMKLFNEISRKDKRSLASKYLHFHFPERFYIFDSRAKGAISQLTKPVSRSLSQLRKHDKEYASFYLRCEALNESIAQLIGKRLLPRELDKVLLAYSGT